MNLSSSRNTFERWAHHSQSQLLPLKMFAPESDHACSVLDSRGQCVSVKKSVSWFWPEQNKDKTKTKHRLGHKGASYLSTLLDTKLIYTNWSTNINLCLWSVSALLHNEDTSVLSVAAVFFLLHLSVHFNEPWHLCWIEQAEQMTRSMSVCWVYLPVVVTEK